MGRESRAALLLMIAMAAIQRRGGPTLYPERDVIESNRRGALDSRLHDMTIDNRAAHDDPRPTLLIPRHRGQLGHVLQQDPPAL